jgi:hypothetical protein
MVLLITMLQKSPPEKELLHKKRKAPPLNLETQLGFHVHVHNSELSTCNFLNNTSMVLLITMLQKSPPEKVLLHKNRKAPPLNPRNIIRV